MPVSFKVQVRSVTIHQPLLFRLVRAVLAQLGESSAEVALSFIGDRRMRRLNCRFRGKDWTTDVLAFSLREADMPRISRPLPRPLGDVVISVPQAIRQAREGRRSVDEELVALLIHGILHLCGYDHERSKMEARRMERRERMIVRALGRVPHLIRLQDERGCRLSGDRS